MTRLLYHVIYSCDKITWYPVNVKMAEFGDNPFADPQDVNPFAVSSLILPIQIVLMSFIHFYPSSKDPSVQEVQTEPQKEEEYNPFAEQETKPDDTVSTSRPSND